MVKNTLLIRWMVRRSSDSYNISTRVDPEQVYHQVLRDHEFPQLCHVDECIVSDGHHACLDCELPERRALNDCVSPGRLQ